MQKVELLLISLFISSITLVNSVMGIESSTKVYVRNLLNHTVESYNLDGSGKAVVISPTSYNDFAFDFSAGKLYWADSSLKSIHRSNLDGSSSEVLLQLSYRPSELTLDLVNGKILWVDSNTKVVMRANLDGSGSEQYSVALTNPSSLLVSGSKLYLVDNEYIKTFELNVGGTPQVISFESLAWPFPYNGSLAFWENFSFTIDPTGGKIYRSDCKAGASNIQGVITRHNLDGSNPEIFASTDQDCYYKTVLNQADGRIYYFGLFSHAISRLSADGNESEQVLSLSDDSNRLLFNQNNSKLYYNLFQNDDTSKRIYQANFDGTSNIAYSLEPSTYGLGDFIINQHLGLIFWIDTIALVVKRANLDGSNVQTISTILSGFADIAFDIRHRKLYIYDYYNSIIQRSNIDGSNLESVHTEASAYPFRARYITLDSARGKLYYSHDCDDSSCSHSNSVTTCDLDGANCQLFLEGAVRIFPYSSGFYVSSNDMVCGYMECNGNGRLEKMSSDLSSAETIVEDDEFLSNFSVDVDDTLYWLDDEDSVVALYRYSNTSGQQEKLFSFAEPYSSDLTVVTFVDTDGDGVLDKDDSDDDNDGLSDNDEGIYETDILDSDTDDDLVSDSQEISDGSNPLDRGSSKPSLDMTVCSEWNGFLNEQTSPIWNIVEYVNMSSAFLSAQAVLYSIDGQAMSEKPFYILSGAQTDVLVHDMFGWQNDTYGKVCSTLIDGESGDINGRMVYYKANPEAGANRFQYAFAMPFLNGMTGEQFVMFNTYQPSLDPVDQTNLVTNWIQLSNQENSSQSGQLIFYDQMGVELSRQSVELGAQSRRDFSGHAVGTNRVGVVKWQPDTPSSHFQLRNVRYIYDNPSGASSFDSAFQLEGLVGSGEVLVAPLDTENSSSILEMANVSLASQSIRVKIYNLAGEQLHDASYSLASYSSYHLIVDTILNGQKGIVVIQGDTTEGVIAVVMQYGRTASQGINYMYGLALKQPLGDVLRGSYNTFLEQGCRLQVVSDSESAQEVTLSMTRYDGTVVVEGMPLELSAHGLGELNLCDYDSENNYGVVTVQSEMSNTITASVIRYGNHDDYRFPTPLR